jgi:hypothetical protein
MSRGSAVIFNILTIFVLLAACAVGGVFAYLAFTPPAVPEPLQPEPLPTIQPSPPPTATSVIDTFPTPITPTTGASLTATEAEATATLEGSPIATGQAITVTVSRTATGTVTATATTTATGTQAASDTPTGPTVTPSQTLSVLPFTLQAGSPNYQPNFANTAGCNWMGIGGQAFDLSGHAIIGLVVRVTFKTGTIDALTGSNKSYGDGGYEIFLNDHAEATTGAYTVQLLNATGSPLSEGFVVNTFGDCDHNLILMNFVQNH